MDFSNQTSDLVLIPVSMLLRHKPNTARRKNSNTMKCNFWRLFLRFGACRLIFNPGL